MIKNFENLGVWQGYRELCNEIYNLTLENKTQILINQIGGFMHYLKQSDYKGAKFKEPGLEYFESQSESRIPNNKS
jgi:hypothetical protein